MAWYWILLLVSVAVGPFEALYALNRAWKRREDKRRKESPDKEKKDE